MNDGKSQMLRDAENQAGNMGNAIGENGSTDLRNQNMQDANPGDGQQVRAGMAGQQGQQAQGQQNQQSQQGGQNQSGSQDMAAPSSVTGGSGSGGDLAGSAAGATSGSDMAQEQPGYGSQGGQQGSGDGDAIDGVADQQSAMSGIDTDDDDTMGDLTDGASAASAAGSM